MSEENCNSGMTGGEIGAFTLAIFYMTISVVITGLSELHMLRKQNITNSKLEKLSTQLEDIIRKMEE